MFSVRFDSGFPTLQYDVPETSNINSTLVTMEDNTTLGLYIIIGGIIFACIITYVCIKFSDCLCCIFKKN